MFVSPISEGDSDDGRALESTTTAKTPVVSRRGRLYTAYITGLRMATTYSFEVRPVRRDARDLADPQSIARATQCLPHASEVEVSTGPYFGGRIAVEAADGGPERCSIQGNPNSAQDAYILRIHHDECGSDVNETTVATYVIVQENLPILTHITAFVGIALLIWKMVPQVDKDNISVSTQSSLSRSSIFSRRNIDRFSDKSSVYSITLSERDEDVKKRSDADNTSE
ncbi:unnamed protein product, partial [Leptidea sinapis]